MELSGRISDLLQQQVTRERANAALYYQAYLNCEANSLFGFAKLFAGQSKDEEIHRDKIASFLVDRNEIVELDIVPAPMLNGSEGVLDLLSMSFDREKQTTLELENIYWSSIDERDIMTAEFMHWFIKEQVEEERKFVDLIARVNAIGLALTELELNK